MLNMVTQWNKQCILKKITTTKNKEILLEINELWQNLDKILLRERKTLMNEDKTWAKQSDKTV